MYNLYDDTAGVAHLHREMRFSFFLTSTSAVEIVILFPSVIFEISVTAVADPGGGFRGLGPPDSEQCHLFWMSWHLVAFCTVVGNVGPPAKSWIHYCIGTHSSTVLLIPPTAVGAREFPKTKVNFTCKLTIKIPENGAEF